jgi:hypothetical protein
MASLVFVEKMHDIHDSIFAFLTALLTCARKATASRQFSCVQNGFSSDWFRWNTSWLQPTKSSPRLMAD